jgi:small subunit ribosomal protein S7
MRRHRADRRVTSADLRFNSPLVATLISKVMLSGKKAVAERIVYGALEQMKQQGNGVEPVDILNAAIDNARPKVEVKSRRVGGATYQVPVEVSSDRQNALAMRWIVSYAKTRKGVPMQRALAMELMDAFKNTGNAIKKRDDTHKMAQANKAFAHYRW